MAATKEDIENSKRIEKAEKKKTSAESKDSTMDIKMINSQGKKFKATGFCTDREIKGVFRALNHSSGQTFEVK